MGARGGWGGYGGEESESSLLTIGLKEALLTCARSWLRYIIMFSLGPGLWLIEKESDPHLHKLLQTPLVFVIIAIGRAGPTSTHAAVEQVNRSVL